MNAAPFKKLNAYVGELTISQAAEGIDAALRNARSLLADAEVLLDRGRWPTAASLSILSIEESGKVALLRGMLLADSQEDRRKIWRDYRSHTKKNFMGAFLDFVTESPHIQDFKGMFDETRDHPQILDAVKQIGFYSDCLGKAHWSVPSEVIDEPLARRLFLVAKMFAPEKRSAFTTVDELRLWVKHLKPVQQSGILAIKEAVIACHQEAHDLGVYGGEESMEEIVRFLL